MGELEDADEIVSGESATVIVQLQRETDDEEARVPKVHAPRFPKAKEEGWWLVIGDPKANSLLCIKRFTLSLMCDSYLGCDQEYELKLSVGEAESDDEDD